MLRSRPLSPATLASQWNPTQSEALPVGTKPLSQTQRNTGDSNGDDTNDDAKTLFPLLDLPVEIQRLVIYHALGGPYNITLTYERISMLRSTYRILGVPQLSLPLRLSSHHIGDLTSTLHHSLFTGRLILNSVFILVPLRRQARFEWLRTNTRILHFSDSSVHPERWGRYFDSFEGLQDIEIEFPDVKRLTEDLRLEDVLEGREDARLVQSLDRFLVSMLKGNKLMCLITARFASKEGVEGWDGIVRCDIRFDTENIRIVRRRYVRPEEAADRMHGGAPSRIVHANGNTLDEGSHQSLWEWHKALTTA